MSGKHINLLDPGVFMLAVEKWAQDKPPFIALVAPQIAVFARDIPDIVKHQKKHRFFQHAFPVPRLLDWFALYRSHRRYFVPFGEMVFDASPFGQQLLTFGYTLSELPKHLDELKGQTITPKMFAEGHQYWNNLLRMSFDDLSDDFNDAPLDPEVRESVQRFKDDHETELTFLLLVAFPCWLLHKEWPSTLYHRAIKGNTNAIHKLLRLDPFTLHDPAIGKQIQNVRINGRQSVYEELLSAPLKPVKVKLSSRTLKDMLAGLISLLAETLKQPLNSTEIRDLFDAVAQDADKRDIDTSLPESQEAYTKVIQRNRPEWKPLLQPGQKNLK
jgi:hypothetical protein